MASGMSADEVTPTMSETTPGRIVILDLGVGKCLFLGIIPRLQRLIRTKLHGPIST